MQEGMNPEQAVEMDAVKKNALRKILTADALERLNRVKLANPSVAAQLEMYLVQVYQTGQLKERVSDAQLKQILSVLAEGKKSRAKTKIKRK